MGRFVPPTLKIIPAKEIHLLICRSSIMVWNSILITLLADGADARFTYPETICKMGMTITKAERLIRITPSNAGLLPHRMIGRARADWCVADEFSKANHNPIAWIEGASIRTVSAGEKITLNASGSSDPDNNSLSYHWW